MSARFVCASVSHSASVEHVESVALSFVFVRAPPAEVTSCQREEIEEMSCHLDTPSAPTEEEKKDTSDNGNGKEEEEEEAEGEASDRRDSRVRIDPGIPVVISADGGNEWSIENKEKLNIVAPESSAGMDEDSMSSSSSSAGEEYELEEELRRSSEEEPEAVALRRLTNENTRRNSITPSKPSAGAAPRACEEDKEEEADPEPQYCQYDDSGAEPRKPAAHEDTPPPYHVLEAPAKDSAAHKRPPPPRPTRPPSDMAGRRPHIPPAPSSPPPPTPGASGGQRNGAIVVPPPPTTPPPPPPSSRAKAPGPPSQPAAAPGSGQEPSGQLPKILYEEKDAVRHPDMVPLMYASPPAGQPAVGSPPPPPPPPTAPASDPKRSSFFNKMSKMSKVGKGMKHLKRRLTSPEAHDPPHGGGGGGHSSGGAGARSSRHAASGNNGNGSSGGGRMQEKRVMSVDETSVEERRHGRAAPMGGIQTQKNVKPPKPPPPMRPESSAVPKAKPRLLGGLKDKIVDLEDISCLDALFPFLFSVSRLPANGSRGETIPQSVVDSCAEAFLTAWTRKWRRRAERNEARGTPGGAFHLGECSMFDRRHPVFEAHLVGEKLVALPPSQVSVAAHELLPPSGDQAWRTPVSSGLAVVAVRCCIPAERLLSQLGSTEEPISPLRRHLSLAVLVLLLACALPASVAPSQVMVLLGRHDIRFLLAEADNPEPAGSASLLQRLAPHLAVPDAKESDLEVALRALRSSLLPGVADKDEWRRQMAPLLLPRLFQPFSESDLFAPFLVTLLMEEREKAD